MTYNTVLRALFLDTRPEFDLAGKGTFKHIPTTFTTFFTSAAAAINFSILLSLSILFIRNFSGFTTIQIDGLVISLFLSTCFFIKSNLTKSDLHEKFKNIQNFTKHSYKLSPVAAVAMILVYPIFSMYGTALGDQLPAPDGMWSGIWLGAAMCVFSASCYALKQDFRLSVDQSNTAHSIVVIGATDLAAQFIEHTQKYSHNRVNAIFDDNAEASTWLVGGVPVRGKTSDLLTYNKENEVDTVVIALPLKNNEEMRRLLQRLSPKSLKVMMHPGLLDLKTPATQRGVVAGVPEIPLMPIMDFPIDGSGRLFKSLFDKILAAAAILLFAPLMICCALGIKLASPGPIFFKQKRIGYRNCEFEVFKFRSMHVSDCNTGKLTVRNDPRVFAFGQMMRKLSFDELPQLFNVINGDMSLVGPRPHMPEARAGGHLYFDAISEYPARHRVKPGITGWAQVNGWRGPTETVDQLEKRVMHDLYYIENWSFWLDLKILIKTVFVGFVGKNAF